MDGGVQRATRVKGHALATAICAAFSHDMHYNLCYPSNSKLTSATEREKSIGPKTCRATLSADRVGQ